MRPHLVLVHSRTHDTSTCFHVLLLQMKSFCIAPPGVPFTFWMGVSQAVPETLPQCPHSTSYYKCLCWRSIVWGNSSTYFVFWVPLTLNKNGVCVLISQVLFGFGLFAVWEGRIANLISSSNQKFSHWKNHVSAAWRTDWRQKDTKLVDMWGELILHWGVGVGPKEVGPRKT